MVEPRKLATLFVDGAALKEHIESQGERYIPQTISKYLYRMAQEIAKEFPGLRIKLNYYGVRSIGNTSFPISGTPFREIDIRSALSKEAVPGVEIDTSWGRMHHPLDKAWIMKPESYEKTDLTDDDFVFNEQPKGVLTKLVDAMLERAFLNEGDHLFVYGDERDMLYALGVANSLDANVRQMELNGNKPHIKPVPMVMDPKVVDRAVLNEVHSTLSERQKYFGSVHSTLHAMRLGEIDEDDPLLLVDVGTVRAHLIASGLPMTMENMKKALEQVRAGLGESVRVVLYHAEMPEKPVLNPKRPHGVQLETELEGDLARTLSAEVSLGKIYQSEKYPAVLKQEKWFVPHAERTAEDFVPNIRQYDVDSRIASDMALARFNPKMKRVYLLSSDGDFAYSAEQAKEAGLEVVLVRLEQGAKFLSRRLKQGVDKLIVIKLNLDEMDTLEQKREDRHQRNEAEKQARLQRERLVKCGELRHSPEDDESGMAEWFPQGPTKRERYVQNKKAHKRDRSNYFKMKNKYKGGRH